MRYIPVNKKVREKETQINTSVYKKPAIVVKQPNIKKEEQKLTYTVPEIAEKLRIGRGKAYKLVKQNVFPVLYIDNSIRIPALPFDNWLNFNGQAV